MKIFRIISRSFVSSFKSIFRNFSLSMASIISTVITLVLVSIGMILSVNINNITKEIEDELTIVAFLKSEVKEEEVSSLIDKLKTNDNISEVKLETKEEFADKVSKENEDFSEIINSWEDDESPLHDSIIVKVNDVKELKVTATMIKNLDEVENIKYGESMIEDLINMFDIVNKITSGLVIALVLVTVFLISNTIKITIFSRKHEIDIMRLVGTSNTVIKMPFLFEGFFLGLFGAILPILVTIGGYNYLYNFLLNYEKTALFSFISLVKPNAILFEISVVLATIGAIVGMIGSLRAVKRYLTI